MILAAGIIVVRRVAEGWRYLLLRAYNYWDFPKGEVEEGETPLETALREVEEETGLKDLNFRWGRVFTETAPYNNGRKKARYYLAETSESAVTFAPNPKIGRPEHHEYRWLEIEGLKELLPARLRPVSEWAENIILAGEGSSAKEGSKVHIGTSGWHYQHWVGRFYPEGMRPSAFLPFYGSRFATAEINNSFYRLPTAKTLAGWREKTPADFLFAIKASRYLTHMKKLKDAEEPLRVFLEKAAILGKKLGPVLLQLPPAWHCNPERLRSFLAILPAGYRYAFEFRDQSWFDAAIYQALKDKNAAFCIYDLNGMLSPKTVTADFVYVRLHGPGASYQGSYDTRTLSGWAGAFSAWRRQGREIFCYFDNDQNGYAASNALKLAAMFR